jgi:adenylate kinase
MRLVFLGAPGVGKGTQADRLAQQSQRPKISTGDLLREAVKNQTPLGKKAQEYMEKGSLVPDSVVIGMVKAKVDEPTCSKGFILDGFPRTVPQAEELAKLLDAKGVKLDRVINFVVSRDDVVRRLSGRRSCPKCQAVYHLEFAPPKREGVCDRCGAGLIQRSDDRQETIEARLKVYEEQTAPLIRYYESKRLLSSLDGSGPVDEVYARLTKLLAAQGVT